MHSVHNDHEKELEIISGPPEPNYQDTVLTTHRKELKNHSNTTEVELPKTTFNIGPISDQISKDINRSERGLSTDHRKLSISPMNTYNFFMMIHEKKVTKKRRDDYTSRPKINK